MLKAAGIKGSKPGEQFAYCNFGFGLLGCIIESVTGDSVAAVFQKYLFVPLEMRASLSASDLAEADIMPISRVLPYRPNNDVTITALGKEPLTAPDPMCHFGHTAGAMYTDAVSLSHLMSMIAHQGQYQNRTILSSSMVREMIRAHGTYGKASPTLRYGLGLVIIEDRSLSKHRIIGHQGYAYGCADGAFYEEGTGRQVVFLNGGCSEARTGRLGLCNRDILRFAFQEEMPTWK